MTDTERALELAAEIERHDGAMTPGPWRFGDWSAVFGTMEDPDHLHVLERNLTHAGTGPYVCGRADGRYQVLRLEEPIESAGDRDGIPYLRNTAPEIVAVLRALVAEVEAMRATCNAAEQYIDTGGASEDSDVACNLQAAVHDLRSARGTP